MGTDLYKLLLSNNPYAQGASAWNTVLESDRPPELYYGLDA